MKKLQIRIPLTDKVIAIQDCVPDEPPLKRDRLGNGVTPHGPGTATQSHLQVGGGKEERLNTNGAEASSK
jgi:hypothetical protein